MKTYLIETGDYKKLFRGENMTATATEAFKKYPPRMPSFLTRMKALYVLKGKRGEGAWHYIDTIFLLKKAGYKVEKDNKIK